MNSGSIVSGDLARLECTAREHDGQTHVHVRDARVYAPQVAIGWVFVGLGIASVVLALAAGTGVPVALGLGSLLVFIGIAGVVVNLRRHGAIIIDSSETRVHGGQQDVLETTTRIRGFGVSGQPPRSLGSHTVVIVRDDDSVVPTDLMFASETRAGHVARVLDAALARTRGGGYRS